jgi:diaminopimelate decarboxylase
LCKQSKDEPCFLNFIAPYVHDLDDDLLQGEMKKVMDQGVSGLLFVSTSIASNHLHLLLADRIIYANPCKQSSYIRYAQEVGVEIMTFDNEQELLKIQQIYPHAK